MNRIRRPPKKIALVLGSGGLRVVAQFGALRVIEEAQIPFDSMYCVSGGNFTGGLFLANGCRTAPGEQTWREVVKTPSDVFTYRSVWQMITSPLKMPSLCKTEQLFTLVKVIDIPRLIEQTKRFVTVATRIPSRAEIECGAHPEPVYFATDDPEIRKKPKSFEQAIAASCGIAGVFDLVHVEYENTIYQCIDGSYQHALPIQKAVEDGHDTIIVIRSQSDSVVRVYPGKWLERISYTDSLRNNEIENDKIRIARLEYPEINLFVIEPQWLPETLTTTTFLPSDSDPAIEHLEMVARRVLSPLHEYYEQNRTADFEPFGLN